MGKHTERGEQQHQVYPHFSVSALTEKTEMTVGVGGKAEKMLQQSSAKDRSDQGTA